MKIFRQFFNRQWTRLRSQNRGSILVLTLFIVTSLTLAVSTLASWSLNEMMISQRTTVKLEADNAVEAATEYAMSNLKTRWDDQSSFPSNQFVTNPVTIPSNISTYLWANSDINPANVTIKTGLVPVSEPIYIDPTDPANTFDPQRGKVVTACNVYVYAQATAYKNLGSKQISYTSYACQALQVRNSPLFSHAIFYNMDLEFHPGPNMTITGPVYATGNIWAVCQSGLTFSGPITCSGNFNVGMMDWPTNWATYSTAETGNLIFLPNANGGLTTPYRGSGNQNVNTSYWDSRTTNFSGSNFTDWRDLAANKWGGNLQTSANDVPVQQLTGYGPFVYNVNGSGQNLNYSYAMIEPNQFNPTTNSYHKGVGELDKFERQAGLILKVHAIGSMNVTQTVTLTGNFAGVNTSNATRLAANIGNVTAISTNADVTLNSTVGNWLTAANGNLTLGANQTASGSMTLSNGTVQPIVGNFAKPTSNATAFLVVTQVTNSNTSTPSPSLATDANSTLMEQSANITGSASYNATTNTTTANITRVVGFAYVELETLSANVDPTTGIRTQNYNTSTQILDSSGDVVYPGDVIPQPLTVNTTQITGTYNATTGAVTSGLVQDMIKVSPAVANPGNGTDIWGGMYDGRRATTISTVTLDVGKLKSLVDDNVAGQAANAAAVFTNGTAQSYVPSQLYNGVVYVEFPQEPGVASRLNSVTSGNTTYPGDQITDSMPNAGLVLTDAKSTGATTGVPNPNYNNPAIAGQAGRQQGFTVATNNCMYVDGNYNADGNLATPLADTAGNQQYNSTMPDNPASPDPSCCVAADSVTALSGSWVSRNSHSASPNGATATEFNAAILGGIVPSNPSTGSMSGGSHNFPRFLENWGGIDFRYRGSMVNLFASELGNQPYGTGSYYSPPNREWGFYNQFAQGIYPPGTPNSRTYYRTGFSLLTQAQYNTATAGL